MDYYILWYKRKNTLEGFVHYPCIDLLVETVDGEDIILSFKLKIAAITVIKLRV